MFPFKVDSFLERGWGGGGNTLDRVTCSESIVSLNPCHAEKIKMPPPISKFQPVRLLDPYCWYKFTHLMTNSADPDQLASSEANWSGSTLFAKTGHVVFSKRRVKTHQKTSWNICTLRMPRRGRRHIQCGVHICVYFKGYRNTNRNYSLTRKY